MAPHVALVVQRPVAGLWQKYCQQLERRPLLTRSLTGVVGASLGDCIAQGAATHQRSSAAPVTLKRTRQLAHTVEHVPVYDFMRTVRLALYSGLVGAPMGYRWYQLLDKVILPATPKCAAAVLLKTFCDQGLFAPVATAMYLGAIRCLEGRPQEAPSTIRQQWRPCLMANYAVWPAAHLINFSLVPSSQRILYVNVIAVFWGAFMSQMVNKRAVEQ